MIFLEKLCCIIRDYNSSRDLLFIRPRPLGLFEKRMDQTHIFVSRMGQFIYQNV